MQIRLLGECSIELGGRKITPSSHHLFALLLRLAADPGRRFQRIEIARLLFPRAPTEQDALHSVRQLLYKARKENVDLSDVDGTVYVQTSSLQFDLKSSLALVLSELPISPGRLDVLPGYAPDLSETFAEWLDRFREVTQAQVRFTLAQAIDELRQRGEWHHVEALAHALLAFDPLNEVATLALAEALARSGSKERAVATLDVYRAEVQKRDADIALPARLLRRRIESGAPFEDASKYSTAIFGRGDELERLHKQLRRARTGCVELSLICGEQGSGKTRLIDEFVAHATLAGSFSVVLARNSIAERHRPWSLFSDVLPELLTLPGAAGCDPELLPFLNRLCGRSFEGGHRVDGPEEAEFVGHGITRAIVDLLSSVSSERACLLVIDDSRAIDDDSLEMIRQLAHSPTPLRLHIVVACEAGESREALLHLPGRTLALGPLTAEESRSLVRDFLSRLARQCPEEHISWCADTAAGNPAFLLLLSAPMFAGTQSRSVPPDMISALDQRIANLAPELRTVLAACAVMSTDCGSSQLANVLGLPPFELLLSLTELERGNFLRYENDRLLLRSALLSDRILASTPKSVLSVIHARCAECLDADSPHVDTAWRIAAHWRRAGQHGKARSAIVSAWKRSSQLGRPEMAELSIREHLALTEDPAERVALYDDLIEVTQASGQSRATIAAIDERSKLWRDAARTDPRAYALAFDRLDAQLVDYSNPSSPQEELLGYLESPRLDTSRRLRAARRLIVSADATADRLLAVAVIREVESLSLGNSADIAYHAQARMIFHTVFGDAEEALALAHAAIAASREHSYSWFHMRGLLNATLALQIVGDAQEALHHLERCYPLACVAGMQSSSILIASRLASFALDDGDIESAVIWSGRATERASELSDGRLPSDYLSVKADLAFVTGDTQSARTFVAAMQENAHQYEAPRYRVTRLAYRQRLDSGGGTLSDEALHELLEWHHAAKAFGRHDDDMEAVWTCLRDRGEASAASELLRDYLFIHRREVRAPRYMLKALTAGDPVWTAYNAGK